MACHATNARHDPTNTRDIRDAFIRAVRRRWRLIRGVVRRAVGYERDALGLSTNERITLPEPYDLPQSDDKALVDQFTRDLRGWLEDNVLETTQFGTIRQGQHWTGQFVRDAYKRGWSNAEGRLMQQGVSLVATPDEAIGNLGVPREQLRRLYTRAFENLRDITDDTAQTIRRELTKGLAAGENPRRMADRLSKELDKIQKQRLETLARSEVINSYGDAALDSFENNNVSTAVHGEWGATDDAQTCAFCRAMGGTVFRTSELRGNTLVFFRSQTYRLGFPAHANGRCAPYPAIDADADALAPLDERVPGTIVS